MQVPPVLISLSSIPPSSPTRHTPLHTNAIEKAPIRRSIPHRRVLSNDRASSEDQEEEALSRFRPRCHCHPWTVLDRRATQGVVAPYACLARSRQESRSNLLATEQCPVKQMEGYHCRDRLCHSSIRYGACGSQEIEAR